MSDTGSQKPSRLPNKWHQRAWRRFRRGRPKASVAQIVQAIAALCLLGVAIGSYYYTIKPVFDAAEAEKSLRRAVAERDAVVADRLRLERQARDARDRYEQLAHAFVIDQFAARILSHAEPLLASASAVLDWGTVVTRAVGINASPYERDRKVAIPAFGLFLYGYAVRRTGRDLIEANIEGAELALLEPDARSALLDRIRSSVAAEPAFAEYLEADPAIAPPGLLNLSVGSKRFFPTMEGFAEPSTRSLEERDERRSKWDAEIQRLYAAHRAFVAAVERLRTSLRQS